MSDRVRKRTDDHIRANTEEVLLREGLGFPSRPVVSVARCESGNHVLKAGLGFLGVGKSWYTATDADRKDELWEELPVRPCAPFGIVDPCPEGLEDTLGLFLENALEEKRVMDALGRKGQS